MLYTTILNLIRLKLIQLIIRRVIASRAAKGKNIKTMSLVAYLVELGLTFLLDSKTKKVSKSKK
ncbi:hypothetical protein clem_02405 [Legionella clemsonensis]|uniref:Uncharacterized protein n=1 Tax=Legionella clemsonensis TaxID=1867846 RepID=A0A222NZL3_9GAMM|nr:hypothetical protein clem_02405 [Legionella clemsonensis]